MSEDAGDGSGFDKEAEREKLREKFARDERKRESTRRMSELLLKGATMTNSHCDACGSPIFRQDGREFCPECDANGDATAASAPAETASGANTSDASDAPGADPGRDDPATAAATSPPPEATPDGPDRPDGTQRGPDATRPEPDPTAGGPADAAATPTGRSTRRSPPSADAGGPDGTDRGDADRDAGHAALARALRRHAEAGAEATDPRTAAAHLEAAREAAEALAALRR